MTRIFGIFSFVVLLSACASPGQAGDECTVDEDCAEGLECHMHDGEEDYGECEEHEDDEGEEAEDTATAE